MSYNLIKQLSDKNENWKAQLREGQLYSLSNFRVDTYKEKDSYRPISKEKKINFLCTTVIEELKEAEVTISQHKFEFVDYRTIEDRFDNNKQLRDIIGQIVGVGPQENVHGPTSNEIEDNFFTNNPGPFVIIVTSTIVKTFRGEHYLSSTSATKVYINLEIPETATLINRNVEKTKIEGIPLQFKQEISVEKRITQNRRTIKQITSLEWTSDDQENVFTCLATIENIEKNFGWYYIGCAKCNKKVKSENNFWCSHCKSNSNFPIPRIQLNIDDGTECAVFILFDKEAEKLLHTTARELSNKYVTMNANSTLPNEIEKLIGKTFVFQLKLNDYNWKEGWELYTIEKVFHNISNDETTMKLDHITTEPLQNDEIKETLDQTSDKKTFEVFDTEPSTSANNDPVEPPKKKKKNQMVISQQKHWRIMKSRKMQTQLLKKKKIFEVLDKKPLTSTNNDEKRSKQEHNNGAIPSISSTSNVEDTELSDDNMFLLQIINRRKATKYKSSKKKKLQRRK
ncbi:hypothetical protein SO802_011049 [Lithocarpus litseifolius]|uniref:Replication factor A C-terminal domain-containing protein n=1 Tax=Lithocarpus litseifolius TaxID=425828 RepID=A0AAW2DFY3_9ROSI